MKKKIKKTLLTSTRKKKAKKTVKAEKKTNAQGTNVRFTKEQWKEISLWSQKYKLKPSDYIKKIILDFLNIKTER